MLRDGSLRITAMAVAGLVAFGVGAYGGLAGLLGIVGLEGVDDLSSISVLIGFGALLSASAVAAVSGNARLVWRRVAAVGALVSGLWIVTMVTWDLDVSWVIAGTVTVVSAEVWAARLTARLFGGSRTESAPRSSASETEQSAFELVRPGVWTHYDSK